jgi:hypothetical protein
MIKFFLFPLLLFSIPKALHITYHAGCAGEISSICRHFNIDLDTWLIPTLPPSFLTGKKTIDPYIISHDKAKKIFKLHKDTFNQYDLIITSDIAPLSRIFLQNQWEKPLLIWVCNRFDINCHRSGKKIFPDEPYYALFSSTLNMPNVEVIGYIPYEKYYAETHRKVFAIQKTITPIGINDFHGDIYKQVPKTVNKPETLFIREYINETKVGLSKILDNLKIKNYCGPYNGASDIKDFKAMVHIPSVMGNCFLYENLAQGVIHFIPSKKFYAEQYKKSFSFIDWSQFVFVSNNLSIEEIIDHCEWYREDLAPFFVFFDSYEQIPHLLKTTDFASKKRALALWYRDYKKNMLEKWEEVFSNLLPHSF